MTGVLGLCCFCGEPGSGEKFAAWVKPTFTDYDKLIAGDIVCEACLFYFQEASAHLAQVVGKDKPQKMRNYSHFIKGGEWIPLSKGDKQKMQTLLFEPPFPELAAIAESGQKHIVFRATRNPPGQESGWIQFEEQALYVVPGVLLSILSDIERLYVAFSKSEIESGQYNQYRVMQFGIDEWREIEFRLARHRQGLLFKLALFLAQKGEASGSIGTTGAGRGTDSDSMAGGAARLEEPLSNEHMGAIREQPAERRHDKQSGEVRQQSLFEDGGGSRAKRR